MAGRTPGPLRPPDGFWARPDVLDALGQRDFGALFGLLSKYAGASQTQIAIAVALTQGQVSTVMAGTRRLTAIDVVERVLDGLNAPDTARTACGLAPRRPTALDTWGSATREKATDDSVYRRDVIQFGSLTAVGVAPPAAPAEDADVRAVVSAAAHKSARFGQWADSLAIGDLALATLWLRLGQLAIDYVYAPMVPVFRELEALRDDVFELLVSPDPAQAHDLYLLAGTTCGLLAHASGNLGHLGAAHVQACTALVCARRADHPTLAAWVLSVRALQSEWSGNPSTALRFVAEAEAQVVREQEPSTVAAWLAAIAARAHARMGVNRAAALAALGRAERHHDRIAEATDGPNEFDRIGGILTFTQAKQLYYAGTTYRRIGDYAASASKALAAIATYEAGPIEQRSYGDEAIAWVDLAIARASGKQADLDGATEALRTIEEQPRERRLPTLIGPLHDLRAVLLTPEVRDARRAIVMRGSISEMIATCQRPLTEVSA
jgi:hypothetical protein